ncbi:MAG TPA: winged helix-turn-helix domain-containing protein [Pyrinomonadaceae bacterium]|jgi:serine/threonine-protein kinase
MSLNKQRIEVYEFGAFRLDLVVRQLYHHDNAVPLSSMTFDILKILVENRGELVTREELIRQIWQDQIVEENNLTVRMSALRKALGESSSNRFIETVPARGYRFVARVRQLSGEHREAREEEEDAAFNSLAVLPLINENNLHKLNYLCEGITESLITSLSHIANLRVMAYSTVLRYRNRGLSPLEVGKKLGVRVVLLGRVNQTGDSLTLNMEMIDVEDGAYLWGAKHRRQVSDLITLQEELAREVSENLRGRLSQVEEREISKRYTDSTEANQMYMKGRYFWNQRSVPGVKKAIQYFSYAIRQDPRYSLAFAGLADAYIFLASSELSSPQEAMLRARAAALKALEIDERLAEAHVSLGNIKSSFEFDWQGAEREFKLAIELNPLYAQARHYYANYLTKLGQLDQAIAEINRAYAIDPISLPLNLSMGKIYYFARRYKEVVKKGFEILEIQPRFGLANGLIGLAYLETGRYPEALREFKVMFDFLFRNQTAGQSKTSLPRGKIILRASDPEPLSFMGYAYAVTGKRSKALKVLNELLEIAKQKYVQPHHMAVIYWGLGDKDNAFDWLNKAVVDRCSTITYIKVWPIFDGLRDDPRYEELVRSLRLQP